MRTIELAPGLANAHTRGRAGRPRTGDAACPGKTRRYQLDIARAQELIPRWEKGDTTSPFYDPLKADVDDEKGDVDDEKGDVGSTERGTPVSPEPSVNHKIKEGARATGPDGAGPDAPAPETAPPGAPPEIPPAVQVWRDNLDALQALPAWPMLRRGIPESCDGSTLTLAVQDPLSGFAILEWARQGAEAVLDRHLEVRVRRWVEAGLYERGVPVSGKPSYSAHRRDGALITLRDPAWVLWCDHTPAIEALEARNALANCLPDDLVEGRLFLCCHDLKVLNALYADLGDQLATILGVRIKPTYSGDSIVAALAARAAVTAAALPSGTHG